MRQDPPRLMVRDNTGAIREIEIAKPEFTMGRQSDSDLVLLDSRISRRQARILRTAQGCVLEDMGSRHGTYVNGLKVTSCILKSGDQISLGVADAYTLTFIAGEAELHGLLEEFERRRTALHRNFSTWACCSRWPRCSTDRRLWKKC